MISVAADLVGMHPQTLRIYESKGLVTPQRTAGNTRLYSEADLERLRLIQRLTTRARAQPRRRRARDPARGRAPPHAAARSSGSSARCARDRAGAQAVPRETSFSTTRRASSSCPKGQMDFKQADRQVAGGGRRRAGACAPPRQPGDRTPSTCCSRCSTRSCRRRCSASRRPTVRGRGGGRARATARRSRARRSSRGASTAFSPRPRPRRGGDAQARGRVRLDRAPPARARRRPARRAARDAEGRARRPARHVAGSRGHLPGAREVRPRPDRARRAGQARPGHRPRRGDPPRDPGAVAPDEEQPGADRRPRASARPRSSRGSRSGSSRATCPRG